MSCYVPSSVYHALPVRERRVKFDLDSGDAKGIKCDGNEYKREYSEESDFRLAVRLQEEENAAAFGARRREHAEAAESARRRSGRSCAHGFGLSATPLSTSMAGISIDDAAKAKESSAARPSPMKSLPGCLFGESDTDSDTTMAPSVDAASTSPSCVPPSSPRASIEGHVQIIGLSNSLSGLGSANGACMANANSPAWLQIRRAEISAKNTARAAQTMLEERQSEENSARRRTGMGVFAPKWR